jgi:tRNA-2-methylthio-N6-dimethylallyladenosine synthase
MFSFKYSPRPNTLAGKRLPDAVSEDEKTRRIVALQALQRDVQTELNRGLLGQDVTVLVDAASRRRDTELSGRTSQNVVVNLPGPSAWIGQTVNVRVERAGAHSVWGQARSTLQVMPERDGARASTSGGGAPRA